MGRKLQNFEKSWKIDLSWKSRLEIQERNAGSVGFAEFRINAKNFFWLFVNLFQFCVIFVNPAEFFIFVAVHIE